MISKEYIKTFLTYDQVTGVYHAITIHNNGKFRVKSYLNEKQFHLGYFYSLQDAVVARKKFEESNGFHKNHGKTV